MGYPTLLAAFNTQFRISHHRLEAVSHQDNNFRLDRRGASVGSPFQLGTFELARAPFL
jgi:hypothetical protein